MIFLALAAAASAPQPGALKTFGDWIVGCDNGRACQAVALVPEAEDRDTYLLIVITRSAAGGAGATLLVPGVDKIAAGTRLMLKVDGKPIAQLGAPAADAQARLPVDRGMAEALANGTAASLTGPNGVALGSASLKGLAAAMIYIDAAQHRVGTRGALARPGVALDTSVPPPPLLPVVFMPPRSAKPAQALSVAAAIKLIGKDAATCDYATGKVEPEAHRLDASHSLVLVNHVCGNGAYNFYTSAFVVDEDSRIEAAQFDADGGMGGDTIDNQLVNADWDEKTRRLDSFAKGRGISDCGQSGSFAWDGTRFRLIERTEMGECRGSVDYITTWRARVVQR